MQAWLAEDDAAFDAVVLARSMMDEEAALMGARFPQGSSQAAARERAQSLFRPTLTAAVFRLVQGALDLVDELVSGQWAPVAVPAVRGDGATDGRDLWEGRIPAGDDMLVRFGELVEQAKLAERLGYDCIAKSSHYSAHPMQEFQQIPLLARLSAETPELRLCAGVVLLPLHKPLDVAEQLATLDVMTGGKVIFGTGIGYRDLEFKAFGTARSEAAARFEENLKAIKRLWTEETVTMAGSHFVLEDASCALKPVQEPHPPIWIGANADVAIRRAAYLADAWFVNPHNRIKTIERQVEFYKRTLDEADKPFPDEFPMMREAFVAKTR